MILQGAAPGRMKGLLVSHGNDLYLYGGMPHTAFTSTRAVSATSFAYPEGETIFMKLSHAAGSKWQSVSCEGAIPESRTRIHSGHAGKHQCTCKQHFSSHIFTRASFRITGGWCVLVDMILLHTGLQSVTR